MSSVTVAQVRCPACGRQYAVQTHQSIDAAKEPQLKEMLLQGRFNLAVCPQCGSRAAINSPFIYHDPDKSLFLLFQPMDLRANNMQQQQMVGALQSRFISSLPPEQRRGYMLQPKVYLTLQSMIDDIMVADGITREEIEAARARTALLEQLAQSQTLEELQQKVEQNRDKIDYAFFQMLSHWIEQAASAGDHETAQALSDLRDDLLSLTQPQVSAEEAEKLEVSREELLNLLINERDSEKLMRLVATARPLLDYFFFQNLAQRIEAAEAAGNEIETKRLTKTRDAVLKIMDDLDAQATQALSEAATFIRELISQPNVEQNLRENLDKLDDAFFAVLNANIAEAQRRKDEAATKALASLGGMAIKLLEENAPPEVRLLNRLLQAKPETRRELLQEQRQLVGAPLLALIEQMDRNLHAKNDALSRELQQIKSLIGEMQAQP
ncbi:MAG: CpXC domain-containing protein [Anaerolineae bacterium]